MRVHAVIAGAARDKLACVSDEDCIFCQIVAGELPATIVDEDERTVSFMDINPGARGHALVIPRQHFRDLHDIPADELLACMVAAQRLAARQRDRLGADGVNLVNASGPAAWQSVFHFHMHVIPRWEGDPLRLPWSPGSVDEDEIAAAAEQLRPTPEP